MRVRLALLQTVLIATSLAWSLNLVSFLDAKEGALWLGVLVLALFFPPTADTLKSGFLALAPCWATLGGVTLAGVLSAPVPALVLGEFLRLLPLLLLATLSFDLAQHPECRVGMLRAVCFASVCAAILALLQRYDLTVGLFPRFAHYDQTMYSVFGNQGLLAGMLATALCLLPGAWPCKAEDRRCVMTNAVPAVLMAGTLLLTGSRGGLVAGVAGVSMLVLLRLMTLRTALMAASGVVLLFVFVHGVVDTMPVDKWLGTLGAGDAGGNFRRWALQASLMLAGEHPVLGCGLGHYSRAIPLALGACAPAGGLGANELTTEHAHLDAIEWFCETGVLGLLGLIWVLSRLRLRFPPALAGFAALVCFSMTHPAFYSAPHVLTALLLYTMNVQGGVAPQTGRFDGVFLAVMRGMAVAGALAFGCGVLYPSYLLCRAEDRHLLGEDAREDYERATRAWGFHPDAFESYGIYCFGSRDFECARRCFEQARVGSDSGRIYRLSAMTAAALGEHESACRWYEACHVRWPWDREIQAKRDVECALE